MRHLKENQQTLNGSKPGQLTVMATGGGDHPAFAMWDVALRDDLRAALHSGTRRMRDWMDARGALRVEIPGEDPFFNINTPADLDAARRRLAEGPQWT